MSSAITNFLRLLIVLSFLSANCMYLSGQRVSELASRRRPSTSHPDEMLLVDDDDDDVTSLTDVSPEIDKRKREIRMQKTNLINLFAHRSQRFLAVSQNDDGTWTVTTEVRKSFNTEIQQIQEPVDITSSSGPSNNSFSVRLKFLANDQFLCVKSKTLFTKSLDSLQAADDSCIFNYIPTHQNLYDKYYKDVERRHCRRSKKKRKRKCRTRLVRYYIGVDDNGTVRLYKDKHPEKIHANRRTYFIIYYKSDVHSSSVLGEPVMSVTDRVVEERLATNAPDHRRRQTTAPTTMSSRRQKTGKGRRRIKDCSSTDLLRRCSTKPR